MQRCPECSCPYGYQDQHLWICPECSHEWTLEGNNEDNSKTRFLDSNGNELKDGDSVTVIRDLKAGKGIIKTGTKVKNIRLLEEPVNDHEISCKIEGHGSLYLRCSVVKKA